MQSAEEGDGGAVLASSISHAVANKTTLEIDLLENWIALTQNAKDVNQIYKYLSFHDITIIQL